MIDDLSVGHRLDQRGQQRTSQRRRLTTADAGGYYTGHAAPTAS